MTTCFIMIFFAARATYCSTIMTFTWT